MSTYYYVASGGTSCSATTGAATWTGSGVRIVGSGQNIGNEDSTCDIELDFDRSAHTLTGSVCGHDVSFDYAAQ